MGARLRSTFDLAWFYLSAEWVLLAGIVGFILGLVPAIFAAEPQVAVTMAISTVVLGLALIVRDVIATTAQWSTWTSTKRPVPVDFAGRPVVVPGLPIIVRTAQGRVAIDPEINAELASSDVRVTQSTDRYRLPKELRDMAPYVLREGTTGKSPFNGPNIALTSDLSIDVLRGAAPVVMRPGDFFTMVCSNELTGWVFAHDGEEFDFARRYLIEPSGRALSLRESELNNGIGISALAITNDDVLVATLQTAGTQASPSQWTPSGSGSLEPKDVTKSPTTRLVDIVATGAERELVEETRIPRGLLGHTEVIGYGRWLDRGCKPEFYCVTPVRATSRELGLPRGGQIHPLFTSERKWTASVTQVQLDLSRIPRAKERQVANGEVPPRWRAARLISGPSPMVENPSVSLDLALDALARRLEVDPGFLEDLRREAPHGG